MKIGYYRCSTADQNPARQEQLLHDIGCEKVNSSLAHEGWFESINNHYMI